MNRITCLLAAALAAGTAAVLPATSKATAIDGPRLNTTNVDAHGTDRYVIGFYGGESGLVRVFGDGDTTLELKVYDGNGNLVGSDFDDDGTGYCEVTFTPRWTGSFIIRVINHGNVYNHYTLKTN
jgi:hypothetical protein